MEAKRKLVQPKRGEIYLVSFDPTVGTEMQKTRPALVLQNDIAITYCQCDWGQGLFDAGTVGKTPPREKALRSY